jgi:hypothetical protein
MASTVYLPPQLRRGAVSGGRRHVERDLVVAANHPHRAEALGPPLPQQRDGRLQPVGPRPLERGVQRVRRVGLRVRRGPVL